MQVVSICFARLKLPCLSLILSLVLTIQLYSKNNLVPYECV
ncbi:hypothetical protein MtrunA17_Chr1g0167171 [Medicago truncatula]|uniref:Uncharacterized protein n=1 Tax=Medicago truncatula TaxID=3880 RepID=A0A396JMY5_MEDTR|nr:hypothetical protein MtrunA17_Chr1g0167171 [Medicago truncatula]